MEIAEPAEEWLTSAQAMSLARRTGSDRVLPWEQLGQSGSRRAVRRTQPGGHAAAAARCPHVPPARRARHLPRWPLGIQGNCRTTAALIDAALIEAAMTDSALRGVSPHDRWWLGQLAEWIRIPSVSGDDRHRGDLLRAARWLVHCLRRTGASTAVVPSRGGGPTVLGRWRGPPGAPVVVLYGHYDVQPAGAGWTVPPFEPTLRWPMLVGRGTNDDKGQLLAMLAALTAGPDRREPPATTVLIADGGEEIGSPGLPRVLTRLARTVRPDLVLVCDTERSAAGAPTVTVSQRGHVVMDIEVDSGGPAVHSGRLGGAVIDPTVVLAAALARMSDAVASWPTPETGGPSAPAGAMRLPDAAIIRAARGRVTTGNHLHRRITDGPALSIVRMVSSGGRGSIASRAGRPHRRPTGTEISCRSGSSVAAPIRATTDRVHSRQLHRHRGQSRSCSHSAPGCTCGHRPGERGDVRASHGSPSLGRQPPRRCFVAQGLRRRAGTARVGHTCRRSPRPGRVPGHSGLDDGSTDVGHRFQVGADAAALRPVADARESSRHTG